MRASACYRWARVGHDTPLRTLLTGTKSGSKSPGPARPVTAASAQVDEHHPCLACQRYCRQAMYRLVSVRQISKGKAEAAGRGIELAGSGRSFLGGALPRGVEEVRPQDEPDEEHHEHTRCGDAD